MDASYNLVDVLKTLIRWKKPIAIFVVIAAISSTIVSLLLPDYFQSKSSFYPSNLAANGRQALFSEATGEATIDIFGSKNDVNRLMTVANSTPLMDFLINKFELAKHYNIDSATTKYWRYKVRKEFLDNYDAVKTEFGAIEITFEDKDPIFASNLVNTAVQEIDTISKNMIVINQQRMLDAVYNKMKEKQVEVAKQADSLAALSQEYKIEELVSKGGGGLVISGGTPQARELYKTLFSRHGSSMIELNNLTTLYDQHVAWAKQNASTLYIVEKAYPAERKSWPIRWLIVVATTLVALFLGLVGALLIDRVREIKVQLDAK